MLPSMMIMSSFRPASDFRPASENRFRRGFTLLEVLVALSVIAIVLVGALRLQGQSVTMNEITRFYSTAPFLAQDKMAEIRLDPQRFAGSESGNYDDIFPGLQWMILLEEMEISNPEGKTLPLMQATVTIQSESLKTAYTVQEHFYFDTEGR